MQIDVGTNTDDGTVFIAVRDVNIDQIYLENHDAVFPAIVGLNPDDIAWLVGALLKELSTAPSAPLRKDGE